LLIDEPHTSQRHITLSFIFKSRYFHFIAIIRVEHFSANIMKHINNFQLPFTSLVTGTAQSLK
jgi:hypothetical protein